MKHNPRDDSVNDALLMAIWRRKPEERVPIYSDQGTQYSCSDWRKFLEQHDLEASMSRRGNCRDNAASESSFSLLKSERIKRRSYRTRNEARSGVFGYIEFYYNPKRHLGNNDGLSQLEYEKQYYGKLSAI